MRDDMWRTADRKTMLTISCSFLQIYCEKIHDLLGTEPGRLPILIQSKGSKALELPLREDPKSGFYVQGLRAIPVKDTDECLELLEQGQLNRATSETRANMNSSRSHTIFQLNVEIMHPNGRYFRNKLNFCDLAGSEKIRSEDMTSKSRFTGSTTMKEHKVIN